MKSHQIFFSEIILSFLHHRDFISICYSKEERTTLIMSPSRDKSTAPPAKNSAEGGLWAMPASSTFPQLHIFLAHCFPVAPYREPSAGKRCEIPTQNGYFGIGAAKLEVCNWLSNWKTWLQGIWTNISTTETNPSLNLRKTRRPRRAICQQKCLASWIVKAKPFFTTLQR